MKTKEEMQIRLSQLNQLLSRSEMSLSTSAERDSIINWGIDGWNEFLVKKQQRRLRKQRKPRRK